MTNYLHNQSINQSIQSYIALLYIPKVALQSPESSCHSYTVIPVVVSYLSSSNTDRSVAANQRQRPLRPPPTFIHIHTMQCMSL